MEFLRNLKVSSRLTLLALMFTLGFLIYGVWTFRTLSEFKVNGPIFQNIVQSKDLIADILPPPEYVLESYLVCFQIGASDNVGDQAKLVERLTALKAEYDTRHDFWGKEKLNPEIADLILKQSYTPSIAFYDVAFKELVPAAKAQNKEGIVAAMAKLKTHYDDHLSAINRLVEVTNKHSEKVEAEAVEAIRNASIISVTILILFVVAGVVASRMISVSITAPLEQATEIAESVAKGDFTTSTYATYGDEISQLMGALQNMVACLSSTLSQVRQSAETISSASKEIESGNMDLSLRTEDQSKSLEATSSTMEELTSTVKQNADNAGQANQLVVATTAVAIKGGEVVGNVVKTMELITQSSRKIVDIIAVIDGIAFQTNILALNAAVEAARAGEQGRGFAVVASEVRSLAQRSASAAKEIKELIAASVETVDTGSRLVGEAGDNMQKIVSSVRQVADIMSEIAAASREQSLGIEQVNLSITQMDQVTQQNTALVEESAAAATSMQQEAQNLMREIINFRFNDAAVVYSPAPTQAHPKPKQQPQSKLLGR
ncbi:MAG: HAMP domain-containing protein [Undibacterium sp.]|nr:HAMP domain-containing protein [Undibacterium sp.]